MLHILLSQMEVGNLITKTNMKEVKVKSYTRKTKSGKSVIVRAHTTKRKCSDGSCKDCGSGAELLKKKQKVAGVRSYNREIKKAIKEWESTPQGPERGKAWKSIAYWVGQKQAMGFPLTKKESYYLRTH